MIFILLSTVVLSTSLASSFNGNFEELGVPLAFNFDEKAESVQIHRNVTTTITAKYGDSVQFECYASGSSPVIITWTKHGDYSDPNSRLLPNGKTEYEGNILKIPSVTQKSHGTYNCIANINSFTDSQYYTLDVKSQPLIIETSQKNEFGSYILLTCTAYSNPKSTFKWYKNGEQLTIEDKDEVDGWSRDSFDSPVISSLNILTKDNNYGGSYKCEIENEFGKDEQMFEINGSIESATP